MTEGKQSVFYQDKPDAPMADKSKHRRIAKKITLRERNANVVFILLFFSILAFGGVVFIFIYKNNRSAKSLVNLPLLSQKQISDSGPIQAPRLVGFTSADRRFTFDYPNTWSAEETDVSASTIFEFSVNLKNGTDAMVKVTAFTRNISEQFEDLTQFADYLQLTRDELVGQESQEREISATPALVYKLNQYGDEMPTALTIIDGYALQFINAKENNYFEEILDSFRFTVE